MSASDWRTLTPEQRQAIADGWTAFLRSERGERYAMLMSKVVPDARFDAAIQESMAGEFLHELAANAGWQVTAETDTTGRPVMRPNPERAQRDAVERAVAFREVNDLFHYQSQLQVEIDVDSIVPRAYRIPEGRNAFAEDDYEQANDQVHAWTRRFRGGTTTRGLLWQGLNGSGKSTMCAEVARHLLRARIPLVWLDPHELVYTLADSRNGALEADLLERCSQSRVVCLNDLGAEKKSDAVARFLCRLLEAAAGQGQAVLISTNLTQDQIREHFGRDEWGREQYDVAERVLSRLTAVTEVVGGWPPRDLRSVA